MRKLGRRGQLFAIGWLLTGCPSDSTAGADVGSDGTTGHTGGDTGDDAPTTQGDSSTGAVDDESTTGDPASSGSADATDATDTTGTSGETGQDTTAGSEATLLYLSVEPPESTVELDLGEASSIAFTVLGHYSDGDAVDLTDQVEAWTVGDPTVGAMNGATLEVGGFPTALFASTVLTADVGDEQGHAQITVAAYNQTGPNADFFFVLPYQDPGGPQDKPLAFSTNVKSLDVFFNMDTTASMAGPIANLQTSLVTTIIPAIEAEIADTWFGAGHFEDFPISTFGNAACPVDGQPDQPFTLLQAMTNAPALVQAAVDTMSVAPGGAPVGCGGDTPEANIESLYQIATGEGLAGPAPTDVAPNNAGVGGAAFREGTMPVIVSITDAVSQEDAPICLGNSYSGNPSVSSVAHDRSEMFAALQAICARIVPVAVSEFSTSCGPLADGTVFATTTGAVIPPEAWDALGGGRPVGCAADECCTGLGGAGVATDGSGMCPLVYRGSANGTGLDATIVGGVQMLARYAPFTVTTHVDGLPQDQDGVALPLGTTSADFIAAVTPLSHGPVPVAGLPDPTLTATTFQGVVPDTDVTFGIEAFNAIVTQGPQPRLFVATIRVLADGCSDLDEREVFILVPPAPLPPPG